MDSKFERLYKKLILEDFSDYYNGLPDNGLFLRNGERIGRFYPEKGDIIQVQASTTLDVAEKNVRYQIFNTYVVKNVDKDGMCTLVFSDMIQGTEIEVIKNPSENLDSTYTNSEAHPEKVDTEIMVNFNDYDKKALNYMHDNIWSCCLIDQFKKVQDKKDK